MLTYQQVSTQVNSQTQTNLHTKPVKRRGVLIMYVWKDNSNELERRQLRNGPPV